MNKFFSFKNKQNDADSKNEIASNPYTQGAEAKKEWNDRYRNMAKATRNWQIAFASAIGLTFILIIIVVYITKIWLKACSMQYIVH